MTEKCGHQHDAMVDTGASTNIMHEAQSLQVYAFACIFTDFQGLIRVYGFTINLTGFPASFSGSSWLVFSLFLWKNKP